MAEGSTKASGAAGAGALTELFLEEDHTHVSLIPDDVIIRDYLSCINDDTWIRHAELVKISDLKETEHEEAVKQEVLRTFIEERRRTGESVPMDPTMEGILWQEQFMEDYKKGNRAQDKEEATKYRTTIMKKFRERRSSTAITSGPNGEKKAIGYNGGRSERGSYPNKTWPEKKRSYSSEQELDKPPINQFGGKVTDNNTAKSNANVDSVYPEETTKVPSKKPSLQEGATDNMNTAPHVDSVYPEETTKVPSKKPSLQEGATDNMNTAPHVDSVYPEEGGE